MRIKSLAMIILSMLFALPLMGAVAFADSATTEASIIFTEGPLEFDDSTLDTDMYNMDIYFGTHQVPTSAFTYTAADGDHTLRISDARTSAGNWEVHVAMTTFTNTAPSAETFIGAVTLADGQAISVLGNNIPGTDFVAANGGTLEIESGDSEILVMSANPDLDRDSFDLKWLRDDVTLYLDAINAAKVVVTKDSDGLDYKYVAEMTWTLTEL